MTDSTKQPSSNASQTIVNSEMTASLAKKWAVEMDAVEENFRKLLNQATVLRGPLSGEEPDLYNRHKRQLVNSMLFYTTRIISDGMKFVMEGNAPSILYEVLQKVHLLQQEILRFGTFPQDFKKTCEQFDLQDFRCPNPLVLFLKMALSSGNYISGLSSIRSLLSNLDFKTIKDRQKYTPGIPACIMALNKPEHGIIISATKDRYNTPELKRASAQLWDSQLKRLRAECFDANFERMLRLEKLSKDFMGVVEMPGVKNIDGLVNTNNENLKHFLEVHANDPTHKQVDLTGNDSTLATWKPDGQPMPACILDYYRFHMHRPQYNQIPSSRVFGARSCAEWFGYLELASSSHAAIKERPLPHKLTFGR